MRPPTLSVVRTFPGLYPTTREEYKTDFAGFEHVDPSDFLSELIADHRGSHLLCDDLPIVSRAGASHPLMEFQNGLSAQENYP